MRLLIIILLLLIPFFVFAEEVDPFPQNKGSIYEYGDDIPDVCFFGADARWNGDKVTSGDWFKLTAFFKSMFIIEGSDKLGYDELNGWAVLDEMNQIATDTLKPILMESALKVILLRDYKPKA